MVQHPQLILIISIVGDLLREMLFLCIVAVPKTIHVLFIRLEEFNTVWIVHIEGIINDCLLAIETSSLSFAIARRHVVLDTAIIEINDVDVA